MSQLIQNISLIITAVLAIITLIFEFIKSYCKAKPEPFMRHLGYMDEVALRLCNFGAGLMKIRAIRYQYKNGEFVDRDLVEIVMELIPEKYKARGVMWSTFLRKADLVDRVLSPKDEVRLIEYVPRDNEIPGIMEIIDAILEDISVEVTYKDIYGFEGKKTCNSVNKKEKVL